MTCIRCGNEMVNTTGGNYHCPKCNMAVNDLMYRPSNCDLPMHPSIDVERGWICPICGRGVSPKERYCCCTPTTIRLEDRISWATTSTSQVDSLSGTNLRNYVEGEG